MNNQLIIRFPHIDIDGNSLLPWFMFDQLGQLTKKGVDPVSQIDHLISDTDNIKHDVQIIVPNDAVLLAKVNIPSNNPRQIKQALPYVIEELIAEEIESVHMALPSALNAEGGNVEVAIIRHYYLINWLDVLHHNNLHPTSMVIDTLCIPMDADVTVLVDGDQLLIRGDKNHGVCCESQAYGDVFPLFVDSLQQPPNSVELIHCLCDKEASSFQIDGAIECHYQESSDEVLASALSKSASPINLLQGGYKQSATKEADGSLWRAPLIALAAGIAIFICGHLALGFYYDHKASEAEIESVAFYKSLFPNERRVVNPKRQLQTYLRIAGDSQGGAFLSTLSNISGEFKHFTQTDNISVNEMNYSNDRKTLKLELTSKTIEQLDNLKQQLAAVGVRASIGSARVQDDGVISNMTVESM